MEILILIDKISCEIDNKKCSMDFFIELSKAFDTLDHKIIIDNYIVMVLEVYHLIGL